MIIVYGNDKLDIPVFENDTIDDVLEKAALSIKVHRHNLKLIHKGKILSENTPISEIQEKNGKLVLVGSDRPQTAELDEVSKLVRDDLTEEGRNHRRPYAISVRSIVQRNATSSPYRFHKVTPLAHYTDSDKAHAILTSLATDPAILHVLELHKWSVGELCEMEPEGFVGVSEVCVLGLNQNKGQKIFLRLRTDDKLGFRKALTIRNVLYHELAHNEHSDHNDAFYMLMRQVQREAESGDWRRTKGHRLTNRSIHNDVANEIPEPTQRKPHIVGGNSSRSILVDTRDATKADVDVNDTNDDDDDVDHESECCAPALTSEQVSTDDLNKRSIDNEPHAEQSNASTTARSDILPQIDDSHQHDTDDTADMLSIIDIALAQCLSYDAASTSEYVLSLAGALSDIANAVNHRQDDFIESCTLLRDIVVRAQDANYRTLKRHKKLYQRVIGSRGCEPVLHIVGFQTTSDGAEIKFTRNDSVRLYLACTFLDLILEASKNI